jgi:hypothetical protein
MLGRYSNASAEYLLTILYRVGDLYGHDLRVKTTEQHKNIPAASDEIPSSECEPIANP